MVDRSADRAKKSAKSASNSVVSADMNYQSKVDAYEIMLFDDEAGHPIDDLNPSSYSKRSTYTMVIMLILLTLALTLCSRSIEQPSFRDYFFVKPPPRPTTVEHSNVIFILADDMGYNSLRSDITPFLVSIRDQGITLTKYYSQELCTPARASLLTGRYPLSVGLQHGSITVKTNGSLNLDETTIADVLKANGYTNYMYGKWNLGNASPRELPTARGFHQYLGFLASEQDYWSKHTPSFQEFKDFLYADTECYYMYDGDDLNHYSTNLYREKAIETIENHDFDASPMFMYLSMQAPHAPFADLEGVFPNGIPISYVAPTLFQYINATFPGSSQQQYYLSLSIMDSALSDIYMSLLDRGQADRTYIIFASDNGGCPTSGGRNTPLRGGKSTLFEGGTLVESFIYSPMLPESVRGGRYEGLYHVSDWFPTILGMVNVKFTPKTGFELDGFDQYNALLTLTTAADVAEADGSTDERGGARGGGGGGGGGVDRFSPLVSSSGARRGLTPADNNNKGPINMAPYKPPTSTTSSSSYPRVYILYNYYYNVEGQAFDFMTRGGGAIRNDRFKLLHTYLSSEESWFGNTTVLQNDDNLSSLLEVFCSAPNAITGNYTYFFFDLEMDPEEKMNLYNTSATLNVIQDELYAQLQVYASRSRLQVAQVDTQEINLVRWHENGDYITPWVEMSEVGVDDMGESESVGVIADDRVSATTLITFPKNCGMYSNKVVVSSG